METEICQFLFWDFFLSLQRGGIRPRRVITQVGRYFPADPAPPRGGVPPAFSLVVIIAKV